MPRFQIPDRYAPALAEFARLSPEELAAFLQALREEKPGLALTAIIDDISERLTIDRDRIEEIVRLLASLQFAREGAAISVGDLVTELCAAIEASGKEELRPQSWAAFQDAVTEALSEEGAVAITSKAIELTQEYPRIYCYGRVLTDLRPVFRSDVEQEPAALIPTHTLKIVYHEDQEHREFFVALDSNDLSQLASLIERALKKEASLKALTAAKGILSLEVKP